ncbi:hypothetical protein ACFWJU_15765 [Streptomyces mutabilis]|uniref:hypothetical protein n=1 Tax=Streptomyces mutabilis TaxID=67332 RepID=UPI0036614FE7
MDEVLPAAEEHDRARDTRLSGEYCRTLFGGLAADPATVDGLGERAAGCRATLAGS